VLYNIHMYTYVNSLDGGFHVYLIANWIYNNKENYNLVLVIKWGSCDPTSTNTPSHFQPILGFIGCMNLGKPTPTRSPYVHSSYLLPYFPISPLIVSSSPFPNHVLPFPHSFIFFTKVQVWNLSYSWKEFANRIQAMWRGKKLYSFPSLLAFLYSFFVSCQHGGKGVVWVHHGNIHGHHFFPLVDAIQRGSTF
jgi:hypothetical protein